MKGLKKYILVIVGVIFFMIMLKNTLLGVEDYNYIYPHIDTKFTHHFNIDKFEKDVRVGMKKSNVERIIGRPFSLDTIYCTTDSLVISCFSTNYTVDGKWEYSDFAWEYFGIDYDTNYKVTKKVRYWSYD